MRFTVDLPPKTWAAGGAAAESELVLPGNLPETTTEGYVYLRGILFRFAGAAKNAVGSITSPGGGSGSPASLGKLVTLQGNGIGEIVKMSCPALVRTWRGLNYGRYPRTFIEPAGTRVWTGLNAFTPGANQIDFSVPLLFGRQSARDHADRSILAMALLRAAATLRVDFGALADLIADASAATLTLKVTLLCEARRKLRLAPIVKYDQVDFGAVTQPTLTAAQGRIIGYGIAPTGSNTMAAGVWPASTDWAEVGANFGAFRVTKDGYEARNLYYAFNADADPDDRMEDHTNLQTDRSAALWLVHPTRERQGQSIFGDAVRAKVVPSLTASAAANAYSALRVQVLGKKSPEWRNLASLAGLDPETGYAKTASGRMARTPVEMDYVPTEWALPDAEAAPGREATPADEGKGKGKGNGRRRRRGRMTRG